MMHTRSSSDDSISVNSQGVEVHQLSEEGTADLSNSQSNASARKNKTSSKKNLSEASREKGAVDPCKYKTRMCRSWMRDGYCSYENVCCYAHGDSDLRTVHQNTNVLSSLGYFNELMLLALDNHQTGSPDTSRIQGFKGKKASKEDLKAAQVEASLVHFARNSAAQGRGNPPPVPKSTLAAKGKPSANEKMATQPALNPPTTQAAAMVHAPYSTSGKMLVNPLPAFGAVPETRFAYNPYGPFPITHYPFIPHAPLAAKNPQYPDYGFLPTAEQMPYNSDFGTQAPWKHPPMFSGYDTTSLPGNQDITSRFRAL
jgi:hypothetical protein